MHLRDYVLENIYDYLRESFPYVAVIIGVDILPLLAILLWDWSAIEALYLFTLETIIIFWFALRKMWRSKYVIALFVNQTEKISKGIKDKTKNVGFKVPKFKWITKGTRGLLYMIFLILWIPFMFLQLIIIALISGDGFGIFSFFSHDFGKIDLGFFSINLLFVLLILLYAEYAVTYKRKFVKNKEYESTGLINEALTFSLRVLIQQFIIIGLFAIIGWTHIDNFAMFLIVFFKILLDVFSFLFARIWGGIQSQFDRIKSGPAAVEVEEL
ncbi:MAG: DUF6498-containing protein [Bacteroidota bacterium]